MKKPSSTFKYLITAIGVSSACWLIAEPSRSEELTQRPGLKLEMSLFSGGNDVLVSRQPAVAVAKGESPSSLLPAGKFKATWSGEFSLEKRTRLYFSFEGEGDAELFVDGESVLKDRGELGAVESSKLRLKGGRHAIKVTYQSKEDGAGNVRLMWRGRDFSKEPIPAQVFTHSSSAKLVASTEVRQGRALYAELKCAQCHTGSPGMLEAAEKGPSLAGVGSRIQEKWMTEWLNDPKRLRRHARMPKVVSGNDAAHIASHLTTLKSEPLKAKFVGDKTKGGKIFHDLGCIACHRSEADQPLEQWSSAPVDLFHVGSKYKEGALEEFLLEPGKHHAATRMPDFGLTVQEAGHLAEFVRSLSVELDPVVKTIGDAAKGKELVKANHCAQCHDGVDAGDQNYQPLEQLAGKSSVGCIQSNGKGPQYALSATEKRVLTAFIESESGRKSLGFHNASEYAQRQFKNLNCAACHQQDGSVAGLDKVHALSARYTGEGLKSSDHGMAPPNLTYMGEKLKADWMEQLFKGEVTPRTRPWLKQRMPAFRSRAANLAKGFSAQSGVVNEVKNTQRDHVVVGASLYGSNGGFGCATCHGAAEAQPTAVFEAPRVNLLYAGQRLREDYFHRWMRDPRRIDPQTVMPKYYIGKNQTTLPEPLGGDGEKQFEAILQWMLSLDEKSN